MGEKVGGGVTRLLFVCMEGASGDSKGGFGDEETGERWGEGGRGDIVVGRDRERGMVHGVLILSLLCLSFIMCTSSLLAVTSPHLT